MVPVSGLGVVLRYAVAIFVQNPQVTLRIGISLFCGFVVPVGGLAVVLWYPVAGFIQEPQVILRIGISLFCGFVVPVSGLGVVLRYAVAIFVQNPQVALSGGMTHFCGFCEVVGGLGVIFSGIFAEVVIFAFFEEFCGIFLRCGCRCRRCNFGSRDGCESRGGSGRGTGQFLPPQGGTQAYGLAGVVPIVRGQAAGGLQRGFNERNLATAAHQQQHLGLVGGGDACNEFLYLLRGFFDSLDNELVEQAARQRNRVAYAAAVAEAQRNLRIDAEALFGTANFLPGGKGVNFEVSLFAQHHLGILPDEVVKMLAAHGGVAIGEAGVGAYGVAVSGHEGKIQRAAAPVHHQCAALKGFGGIHAAKGEAGRLGLCGELHLLKPGGVGGAFQLVQLGRGEVDRARNHRPAHGVFGHKDLAFYPLANKEQVLAHQIQGREAHHIAIRGKTHGQRRSRAQFHLETRYVGAGGVCYALVGILAEVHLAVVVYVYRCGYVIRTHTEPNGHGQAVLGVQARDERLSGAEVYTNGVHGRKSDIKNEASVIRNQPSVPVHMAWRSAAVSLPRY